MSGKKGRSGRLPHDLRFSVNDLLEKCYRITQALLKDPEVSKEKKLDVSAKFMLKALPDRIIVEEAKFISIEEREALIEQLHSLVTGKIGGPPPLADGIDPPQISEPKNSLIESKLSSNGDPNNGESNTKEAEVEPKGGSSNGVSEKLEDAQANQGEHGVQDTQRSE